MNKKEMFDILQEIDQIIGPIDYNENHEIKPKINLGICKILEITDEKIKQISNCSDLENLTELKISQGITIPTNVCLIKIPDFNRLMKLQHLDLSYNMINSLEINEEIINLSKINLSHNCIKYIGNLSKVPKLQYLNLAFNFIEKINENIDSQNLCELDLSNNMVSDILSISQGIKTMKKLKILKLDKNPMCLMKNYNPNNVLNEFNQLEKIDDFIKTPIKKIENENTKIIWENIKDNIINENLILKQELLKSKFSKENQYSENSFISQYSNEKVKFSENIVKISPKTITESEKSFKTVSKSLDFSDKSFVSAVSENLSDKNLFWKWTYELNKLYKLPEFDSFYEKYLKNNDKLIKMQKEIDNIFIGKTNIIKETNLMESEITNNNVVKYKQELKSINLIIENLSANLKCDNLMKIIRKITNLEKKIFELGNQEISINLLDFENSMKNAQILNKISSVFL